VTIPSNRWPLRPESSIAAADFFTCRSIFVASSSCSVQWRASSDSSATE